ncbi:hypothetical protein [Myxococcus sp. RHSTA-1-4]|uniref:hypothetical protein n=1 Tax=Myxococcus sp. RHSTA-1-4 TaxID=2874601 RepID=UPI001CBDC998|nr:hypothetical protein [Myxococcus sp. RHSTA-1-4]MBZ4422375.1 hypothetical protein [Myxococcus sp. RHSTA-1-4]
MAPEEPARERFSQALKVDPDFLSTLPREITESAGEPKNWGRFHSIDAFNDKASAVRWCIPPGWRVRLYDDSNYAGSYKDFIGDGTLREVNLNSWSYGDKVSSERWLAF